MHPRAHEQYIYIERELAGRGPRRIFQAPDMVYNRLIQLKQHQTGGKKNKTTTKCLGQKLRDPFHSSDGLEEGELRSWLHPAAAIRI